MKLENSCALLIKQIGDTLKKNANNDMKETDLTFAQTAVLLALCDAYDKQLSLKELEKILHVAQSTVARIVTKLESKGFVSSFGDSSDKRIKYICITPLGEQCCNNAKQKMREGEENLLSPLTEIEKKTFINLLQKVKDNLK